MGEMHGRRVLVLGGSSGIGLATARLAHELGAVVTITGRNVTRLDAARTLIGGGDAFVGDITRESDVASAFARLGIVDHVFLAGGGSLFGNLVELPQDRLEGLVQERIWAPVYVARCAVRHMTAGSITLMSGGLGSRPVPGGAMKHAVLCATEGLARGLALELAPLRVNAIAPGYTRTPAFESLLGDDPEAQIARMAAGLPLKRIGRPEEVAQAVLALMTNDFINGEVLHADGAGRFVAPALKFTR
ncbi:MAG: SDR family oxidoreductase [Alphaproteobacteria bacterium]|nr:SDR family oxidoreductase [Alphaproteobacteria bacterium]